MVKVSVCFIRRLYSDYLYFASSNKSADDFHDKVTEALQLFENCMLDYSLRACVYNNTLSNALPVRPGPPRRGVGGGGRGAALWGRCKGSCLGRLAYKHREAF